MVLRPSQEWEAVRAADSRWQASVLGYVAPLSAIPALAWPAARWLSESSPFSAGHFGALALTTFVLCVASVAIYAAGLYVSAPIFGLARSWDRSIAIAARAATPALLGIGLLSFPTLAIVGIVAFLHSFALSSVGAQKVLGCADSESTMYVACAFAVSGLGLIALGGLCSAIGAIQFAFP